MGLDMYLRAEQYVSGYSFRGEEEVKVYDDLVALMGVKEFIDPDTPSANVNFTVAYWRKANHIHQWFVDHVQGGEDECRPHSVSREQLGELREACLRVLAFKTEKRDTVHHVIEDGKLRDEPTTVDVLVPEGAEEAEKLLPTQGGFFFGSTEYDEWYLHDCKSTVEQLDRALRLPDGWYFEYQSSW